MFCVLCSVLNYSISLSQLVAKDKNDKYEICFPPMLCSIVLAQLMPTKPHCSMWNSFCTAAEFPSGCRVLCAHCTAYKGIRKQCKWVSSTDIIQNNTIYPNKVVMGEMFVVMVVLLRRRWWKRIWYHNNHFRCYWVLKRMTVLQVVLNSCSILFLPSNASRANYTAGLQPKKIRPV